eukprot:gene20768-biopygen16138
MCSHPPQSTLLVTGSMDNTAKLCERVYARVCEAGGRAANREDEEGMNGTAPCKSKCGSVVVPIAGGVQPEVRSKLGNMKYDIGGQVKVRAVCTDLAGPATPARPARLGRPGPAPQAPILNRTCGRCLFNYRPLRSSQRPRVLPEAGRARCIHVHCSHHIHAIGQLYSIVDVAHRLAWPDFTCVVWFALLWLEAGLAHLNASGAVDSVPSAPSGMWRPDRSDIQKFPAGGACHS